MDTTVNVTESVNPNTLQIDEMTSSEIVALMIEENKAVHTGMQMVVEKVAEAVDLIVKQWNAGGRVFVIGAGTSGRLGVLDAAELPPTFSIDPNRWMGFIAGGYEAMWKPLEEHEDDEKMIRQLLRDHSFRECDVFIGVTASGETPFVISGITYANELGGTTITISCNDHTEASRLSDCAIEVLVGPEVIKGSTRLKAGTAQKNILNIISTATMIRIGKVYQNQMVEMQLINKKLLRRAERILMEVTDLQEVEACALLKSCDLDLKVAIFVALTNVTSNQARDFITEADGHLKRAIHLFYEPE